MKLIIIATSLIYFLITSIALANCNIKYWNIGDNASSVSKKLSIDMLLSKNGNGVSAIRGRDLCKTLPLNSKASLIIANNKLVQIELSSLSEGGEIFAITEKSLGKAEKKVKRHKSGKIKQDFYSNIWLKGNIIAVYTKSLDDEQKHHETITITSKRDSDLLSRLSLDDENIIRTR